MGTSALWSLPFTVSRVSPPQTPHDHQGLILLPLLEKQAHPGPISLSGWGERGWVVLYCQPGAKDPEPTWNRRLVLPNRSRQG